MAEESTRRRERLEAMRMAASAASTEASHQFSRTSSTPLSNPLTHPESVLESPLPARRFDYYTDPTAAYSAGERNTGGGSSGRGRGDYFQLQAFATPVRKAFPSSHSAERPIIDGQMEHHMSSTYISHGLHFLTSKQRLTDTQLSGSHSGSWRSPIQYCSSTEGNSTGHSSPRPWNTSGCSPGSYGSNHFQGGPSSSVRSSHTSGAYSYVRGSMHSPSRGRSWLVRGRSPSSSCGGGTGRRSFFNRGSGFGRQESDHFYIKSMVKDPWRKLKPIVGNILVPNSGPLSWLPKSISAKKAKVADPVARMKPKQNLAEYLALAFEEAASSEPQGEGIIIPTLDIGE